MRRSGRSQAGNEPCCFWLLGPFILLIERSPADLWLSCSPTFVCRSIARREGWWLQVAWVRLTFLFWAACLVSAAMSLLPGYSLGETIVVPLSPVCDGGCLLARERQAFAPCHATVCWHRHDNHVSDLDSDFNHWCERWARCLMEIWSGQLSRQVCLPAFLVIVAIATSDGGQQAGRLYCFDFHCCVGDDRRTD